MNNKDKALELIGEIIECRVKKLASGDKGLRLVIDINATPGVVGAIDDLWDTGHTVRLMMWREDEQY